MKWIISVLWDAKRRRVVGVSEDNDSVIYLVI